MLYKHNETISHICAATITEDVVGCVELRNARTEKQSLQQLNRKCAIAVGRIEAPDFPARRYGVRALMSAPQVVPCSGG